MKNRTKIFYCHAALLLVFMTAGCTDGNDEEPSHSSSPAGESSGINKAETASAAEKKEPVNKGSHHISADKSQPNNMSADYSPLQIEYARIWLQLGENQQIDELNVRRIPDGALVNPDDHTGARYPEDVTQLAGSRLVDGSVTYSSNGDGTIQVYNVPLRWESCEDTDQGVMKEVTEEMIRHTKKVSVDTGDNEKIRRLIDIMSIH
ncbi:MULTISPECIES: hypothetical protein [Bacillus]|uniref:hypothetical protein n=1 Tax=Bacillus TaxID=1386 RepID=UPI000624C04B|nr:MULTISPECIES: hypothetical protein [Bacillus]AKF32200.1 hypothetical protein AAV29_17310 [Bacillus velezensis]KMN58032.1 hypothetical protein VK94_02010 [Bacillus sp. LK7]MBR8692634.1 hypothetical protein [Bacillus velezensis]MCX2882948.1 hypothetical protein [Bacillus velezensis]PWK00047.1 hypothetical protein C7819_10439 [Bacillus sp. VMFN-A1]